MIYEKRKKEKANSKIYFVLKSRHLFTATTAAAEVPHQ